LSKEIDLFAPIEESHEMEEKIEIEEKNILPDSSSELKIQESDKEKEKIFNSREAQKDEIIEKNPISIPSDTENISQIIVFFENGKYKNFVQK
jgi:hypothetical protein